MDKLDTLFIIKQDSFVSNLPIPLHKHLKLTLTYITLTCFVVVVVRIGVERTTVEKKTLARFTKSSQVQEIIRFAEKQSQEIEALGYCHYLLILTLDCHVIISQ